MRNRILAVALIAMLLASTALWWTWAKSADKSSSTAPVTPPPKMHLPAADINARPVVMAPEKSVSAPDNPSQDSTEDTEAEARKKLREQIIQQLTPPSATPADWKRAAVTAAALSQEASYFVLTHLRPVLEADTNTNAFHVSATNTRGASGAVITRLWSNKIANGLEINWSKASISREGRSGDKGPTFEEMHQDQSRADNPDIGYGYRPPEYTDPGISITMYPTSGSKKHNLILYDHRPFWPLIGFISNNYPVAAQPLITRDTKALSGILLVDAANGKLIGELKLPAEAKSGRPNFILDPDNDVLLAIHFQLDWLMAVDLRPYMQKLKAAK